MFTASLRGSDGPAHRFPTAPLHLLAACVFLCALLPPAASAETSDEATSDVTSHVLIGMKPNQGFEVTCEDSVLYFEPVVADELGIMEFDVEGRSSSIPSTVSIQIPAPPNIIDEHTCAASDSSATICWQTDRLATSHVDYGLTEIYGQSTQADGEFRMTHQIVIGPLEPETTYHYRAVSMDAFGNSTASVDATFTTEPTQPRISNVLVADVTSTSITVTWTTNRPCSSWIEFGSTDAYGSSTPVQSELVTAHEVTVDDLSPYSMYHFRACGEDEQGRAATSEDNQIVTLAPDLLLYNVAVADTTATTATIVWNTTNPATSKVLYGTDESYGSTAGGWDLTTEHSVTLVGLEPETLYHFLASSKDYAGAEEGSGDQVFSTEMVPLEILDLALEDVSHEGFVLSWRTSRPSNALVQFGPDEAYGSTVEGDPGPGLDHTVVVGDMAPCTTYHLRAVSVDTLGYSARSPDTTATTSMLDLEIFDAAVAETTSTTAAVAWRTTGASFCWIEYGPTESYGFATDVSSHPLTEHSLLLADLAPKTLYHLRIHAMDVCGQQTVSGDLAFATPSQDGPGSLAIFGVVATQVGPTFAVICWQTTDDASSTIFYGPTEACELIEQDQTLTDNHCFALTGLEPGTRYYYRVRSESASHTVVESHVYSFWTPLYDTVPPDTPGDVSVSPCESGTRLSWSAGVEYDLERYLVYRRVEGESGFAVVGRAPGSASSYVDASALDGWTYEYAVSAVDMAGNESGLSTTQSVVAGLDAGGKLWIFPNPVYDEAAITFSPPSRAASRYSIAIYDARGRLVRNVAQGEAPAGITSVPWDGRDGTGRPVGSGVYFCVVAFPSESVHTKMMVVR